MKIFFNSSMPRSGSTLLQNIIGQRNDFFVSSTSGLLELLHGSRANFSAAPEFKSQDIKIMSEAFKGFCRGAIEGFYNNLTDKKYVLDKSRGWSINYNFLNAFYENPKIICMVRDLRSILASYEQIIQKNSLLDANFVKNNSLEGTTIFKRMEIFLNKPPIGLAINRIQDILSQDFHKKILFIKYEDFCKAPELFLSKIYEYLEIDNFLQHNLKDIKQITSENDEIYGIYNLHTIKSELKETPEYYKNILGDNLSDYIYQFFKWYFDFFNYAK